MYCRVGLGGSCSLMLGKFDFCQVEIIGKSFENRDMKVMKVNFHTWKQDTRLIYAFISRCVKEGAETSLPCG